VAVRRADRRRKLQKRVSKLILNSSLSKGRGTESFEGRKNHENAITSRPLFGAFGGEAAAVAPNDGRLEGCDWGSDDCQSDEFS